MHDLVAINRYQSSILECSQPLLVNVIPKRGHNFATAVFVQLLEDLGTSSTIRVQSTVLEHTHSVLARGTANKISIPATSAFVLTLEPVMNGKHPSAAVVGNALDTVLAINDCLIAEIERSRAHAHF